MKFLSKLAMICNVCFVYAVGLRYFRFQHSVPLSKDVLQIRSLESTLVVLGYGAIWVNVLLMLFLIIYFFQKKQITLSNWIMYMNLFFLLIQFIYFFI